MKNEDATTLYYELVELECKKLLYTDCRVDRKTVPKGFYCYDIRYSDEDDGVAATLEPYVFVNHMGSVISAVPFSFPYHIGDKPFICLDGDLNFLGESVRLSEYVEQYGNVVKA